jgi:hypothetical protein
MATVLRAMLTLVIGTALGLFVTWATVVHGVFDGAVHNGPWRTILTTGSAESGPYARAWVAVHGLLALDRKETVYYTATTDSGGTRLDGHCIYHVTGRDPAARWWSITAYGADDFLIPNSARRYSVSRNSIERREDGSFVAAVARGPAGANWIPVDEGSFSLTLRLYNPEFAVQSNPAGANLPRIVKVSCDT